MTDKERIRSVVEAQPDDASFEEIVRVLVAREAVVNSEGMKRKSVHLPTFGGEGLRPGVDIDDSRALRRVLDTDGKPSQLP